MNEEQESRRVMRKERKRREELRIILTMLFVA